MRNHAMLTLFSYTNEIRRASDAFGQYQHGKFTPSASDTAKTRGYENSLKILSIVRVGPLTLY